MIELTKSPKKIARQLINLALQRECEDFLNKVQSFLHEVESSGKDAYANYLSLFKKVNEFDEHIARHYDGISGSRYLLTILNLYCAGILSGKDITLFDEDMQKYLTDMKRKLMEE